MQVGREQVEVKLGQNNHVLSQIRPMQSGQLFKKMNLVSQDDSLYELVQQYPYFQKQNSPSLLNELEEPNM